MALNGFNVFNWLESAGISGNGCKWLLTAELLEMAEHFVDIAGMAGNGWILLEISGCFRNS